MPTSTDTTRLRVAFSRMMRRLSPAAFFNPLDISIMPYKNKPTPPNSANTSNIDIVCSYSHDFCFSFFFRQKLYLLYHFAGKFPYAEPQILRFIFCLLALLFLHFAQPNSFFPLLSCEFPCYFPFLTTFPPLSPPLHPLLHHFMTKNRPPSAADGFGLKFSFPYCSS